MLRDMLRLVGVEHDNVTMGIEMVDARGAAMSVLYRCPGPSSRVKLLVGLVPLQNSARHRTPVEATSPVFKVPRPCKASTTTLFTAR